MGNSATKYQTQELLNYTADDTVSPPILQMAMRVWNGTSWVKYRGELINGATVSNTFATVGTSSGTILAANTNRITATLVNDSDTVIYIYKGSTAVSGSGIRLNSSGGAIIIDDYTGIITGICASSSKNVTVCEVAV